MPTDNVRHVCKHTYTYSYIKVCIYASKYGRCIRVLGHLYSASSILWQLALEIFQTRVQSPGYSRECFTASPITFGAVQGHWVNPVALVISANHLLSDRSNQIVRPLTPGTQALVKTGTQQGTSAQHLAKTWYLMACLGTSNIKFRDNISSSSSVLSLLPRLYHPY